MDGAHDMGGVKGYGPVVPEANEPVFHAEWERRAFALTVAMARPGGWNIDMSRFARENRPPADYLSKTYYEIWLAGLETLMIERGLVTREEIDAGKVLVPPKPGIKPVEPAEVTPSIRRGGPTERKPSAPAQFAVGDKVRITAQLVETESGNHIWSDKVNGTVERVGNSVETVANGVSLEVLPQVIELSGEARSSMRALKTTMSTLNEQPQSILFGAPDIPPGPGEPGFSAPGK